MIEKIRLYFREFQEDRQFSVLAFLVFICPLAFSTYLYENFETQKYFLWLSLIGWSLFFLQKNFFKQANKKIIIFFSLWLILAVISTLLSVDFITSVFGFPYRFTSGLVFYTTFAIFILVLSLRMDFRKKHFLYQILTFDAGLVALLGLFQSIGFFHYEGVASTGLYRSPSFLGNPNFSSMFLAMVLPLSINLFVISKAFKTKVYYGLVVVLSILAVLVLASRGSVLAVVISILCLSGFWAVKKKFAVSSSKILAVVVTSVIIFVGIVSISRPDGFLKVFKQPDINVTLRLKVWQVTFDNLQKIPFFGIGPGNFQIFFEQSRGLDMANEEGIFDDAHNIFLQIATTTGIPFLLMFLGLIVWACVIGWKKNFENDLGWSRAEIAAVIAFLVAGSFNPVTIACFMVLGVVVAGLFSKQLVTSENHDKNNGINFRGMWFWFGLLLIYLGSSFVLSEFVAAYGYRQYFKAQYTNSQKALIVAHGLNPFNRIYELYLIGCKIKLNGFEKQAQDDIELYLKKYPVAARTYVQGANLYYGLYAQTGKVEYIKKAVEVYAQALKIDPFFGERYGHMAIYYYILSDFNNARKYTEISLKMKPDFIPTLVLQTKIYEQLGMQKEALEVLDKAFRLSPDNMQLKIWNSRAKYFKNIGQAGVQVQVYEGKLE